MGNKKGRRSQNQAHELEKMGDTMFMAKNYVGALQQYENAIKLSPQTCPGRAIYHSNKAACLMKIEPIDYKTVISECTFARHLQPNFIRALLERALAYEGMGNCVMAILDVLSVLRINRNDSCAREILCRLRGTLKARQKKGQQDLPIRLSPVALVASTVRGARPVPKEQTVQSNKSENLNPISPIANGTDNKNPLPKVILKPSNDFSMAKLETKKGKYNQEQLIRAPPQRDPIKYRPLKLVYDHDIRLAEMPVNSSFKILRDVVGKRFPMLKAVLIKYKDSDGDLVTIMCSSELRLAESSVDNNINVISKEPDNDEKPDSTFSMLRLQLVEVNPEQEPPLLEEEEEEIEEVKPKEVDEKEKIEVSEDEPECKEVEMDDWLFNFAQIFLTYIGIDPDSHIDLHKAGMELCSEALKETVTSEEAQTLFDKAASKFEQMATLAFYNLGNVYMCAAQKRNSIDEACPKETMDAQIKNAYDWMTEKYTLAKGKFKEALLIRPDFYHALFTLGQQQFNMAKLHWWFVLAKKSDLSKWDPTEMIWLFNSAEKKIRAATKILEKMEAEQRANESKQGRKDEMSNRQKNFHITLGNMLFERSQIVYFLGLSGWNKKLDAAVERFKLGGISKPEILTILKKHCWNRNEEEKVEEVRWFGEFMNL